MKHIYLALMFAVCVQFSAAHAQSATETRLQIASQQSALGHRLVRAMCFVKVGIDIKANTQIIKDTRSQISDGIHAMMKGGGKHQLSVETDRVTLTLFRSLDKVWSTFGKEVDEYIIHGDISVSELQALSVRARSLDRMWANILKRIETRAKTSDIPETLDLTRQAHAAGVQSKHLQIAGKLACLTHLDPEYEDIDMQRVELISAVKTFDEMAFALAFSNRNIGYGLPPSDDIQLSNVEHWQDWTSLRSAFIAMSANDINTGSLRTLSFDIENLNVSLGKTSMQYRDYAIAQAFKRAGFDLGG